MIFIQVPSVPIPLNNAYVRIRGGGRALSQEGKKYKNETKTYIVRNYPQAMSFFKKDVPYVLVIEVTFKGREHLYCKGWPDGDAQNRYKRNDIDGRSKLFLDALSQATAVDDSHNFSVTLVKTWHRDYEATRLWAWNREEERDNPVDELIKRLREAQPH